jgi:hypothetical protein
MTKQSPAWTHLRKRHLLRPGPRRRRAMCETGNPALDRSDNIDRVRKKWKPNHVYHQASHRCLARRRCSARRLRHLSAGASLLLLLRRSLRYAGCDPGSAGSSSEYILGNAEFASPNCRSVGGRRCGVAGQRCSGRRERVPDRSCRPRPRLEKTRQLWRVLSPRLLRRAILRITWHRYRDRNPSLSWRPSRRRPYRWRPHRRRSWRRRSPWGRSSLVAQPRRQRRSTAAQP